MFCLRARVNDASDYQWGVRLSTEKKFASPRLAGAVALILAHPGSGLALLVQHRSSVPKQTAAERALSKVPFWVFRCMHSPYHVILSRVGFFYDFWGPRTSIHALSLYQHNVSELIGWNLLLLCVMLWLSIRLPGILFSNAAIACSYIRLDTSPVFSALWENCWTINLIV
jgi:hypothetical protein